MIRLAGICIVLFSAVTSLRAQQLTTLTGRVLDASNNRPLPNVSVYFNNTTLGSSTDQNGVFVITKVPSSHPTLVVSAIGYRTVYVPALNLSTDMPVSIEIKIVPQSTVLAPITITDGRLNSSWSRRYNAFRRILLGNTANAARCEILNPEVISFTELASFEDDDAFTAHAIGPIEIENRGLGYKLSVTINEFESRKQSYRLLYSTRFDSLRPGNEREQQRWDQSRIDTYKGSQRHFFMSVAAGTYAQEGFRVLFTADSVISGTSLTSEALLTDLLIDSTRAALKMLKKGIYQIHYSHKVLPFGRRNLPNEPNPVSWLSVSDPYLRLYSYGEVITPANFRRSGYMDDMRLADLLPYDYDASWEESHLLLQRFRESVVVRGTVLDENSRPLAGAEVFINNGLTQTKTNAWGNFELPPLDPGKYPLAVSHSGNKDTLVIVDCTSAPTQSVSITMRRKPYRRPVIDVERNVHQKSFEYFLFRPTGTIWEFEIINPGVLQYEQKENGVDVWATAPLMIENLSQGYQWTLFINRGSMTSRKMTLDAMIKMDTIEALRPAEVRKWEKNRLERYLGSWNHFVSSLQNGTSGHDGFDIYQVTNASSGRRPRFNKPPKEVVVAIEGDSILSASDGLMYLQMKPGLEIHNSNRRRGAKFYRGTSKEIMRLSSDLTRVPISRTGIVSAQDLTVTGPRHCTLPSVPVDMPSLSDKASNPELLLLLKRESLAQVKTLLEKVYVHTDRSHYNPGDTLWLKAYLRYADARLTDSLSKVLYVDIVDPLGRVVSSAVLKVARGQARGVLALDGNLPAGNYYLRAYTNWMRNFDEIFIMPVPLIARGNFIEPGVKEVVVTNDSVQVSLTSDKEIFKTRSPVVMKLHVGKNGAGTPAIFSIAVTDQSAVPELAGSPTISELLRPYKATGSEFIRINHPVEKGITLNGSIPNAIEDTRYNVWALLKRDSTAAFTTSRNGKFSIVLDFVDTTTAVIKAEARKAAMRTEISEVPPLRTLSLPAALRYNLAVRTATDRTLSERDSARVLPEVMVRATRISGSQPVFQTLTQARFGFPVRVGQGADLHEVRKNSNLMNYLRFQNLLKFARTLCLLGSATPSASAPFGTIPDFGGNPECGRPGDPLYTFYFDGLQIDLSEVSTLPLTTISRIEVYTVTSYVIAIYTESMIPYDVTEYDKYKVRGYDSPALFRTPKTSSQEPDTRATVYWNPDVEADDDGNAIITFPTTDVSGTYKVVIEGLTTAGQPFRVVKYLNIE